ncbi:MAG: protease pro-enzyme activation domain-containing protein, partial [Thermoproteota archaeon]
MDIVPYAPGSVSSATTGLYKGEMHIMVTFKLSNESRLLSYLSNLSNPVSSQYHKYLSKKAFVTDFSPSTIIYTEALNYFSSFAGTSVTTYQDRISIVINGPAISIDKMFNTTVAYSKLQPTIYYASSPPELPSYLDEFVSYVSGFTNKIDISQLSFSKLMNMSSYQINRDSLGYPEPVYNSGIQYIYGSDIQVAYDEQSLLNVTFPVKEVIATILWSGYNSSNQSVAPFYPSDIYAYYKATLPSFEPHSVVYGVPINGAPKPGISASYDISGASSENTLDLEMIGSTAPGSSIFNV